MSAKSEAPREFSSTQINLATGSASKVLALGKDLIPDSALAEGGREEKPHITVKFGLHDDEPDGVQEVLADEGPITVKLGKTSVFPAREGSDYDVVKIDVHSPDLVRLNKKISDALEVTDTHATYEPHVTLAYVLSGEGAKYTGDSSLEGTEITFDTVHFSDKTGKLTKIPLISEVRSRGSRMNKTDTQVYFGDPIKALGDGRVGGYLVRFSDKTKKDLCGDFFTAKTYLGPADGNGAECLFDHGYPILPAGKKLDAATKKALLALADITLAPLKTKRDAIGIWAETILDLSDDYQKMIHGMVKDGRLGWSSGSAGHRVKRTKDGEITSWPIGEGSMTPTPAEPLNVTVALKSYFKDAAGVECPECGTLNEQAAAECKDCGAKMSGKSAVTGKSLADRLNRFIDDLDGDRAETIKHLAHEAIMDVAQVEEVLAGQGSLSNGRLKAFARVLDVSFETLRGLQGKRRTIKGMFADALAEDTPSRWQLDSAFCDVVRDLAAGARGTRAAGAEFDYETPLKDSCAEYLAALQELTLQQLKSYLESDTDDPFYLKAIINLSKDLPVSGGVDLSDHGLLAVSAFKDLVARFTTNHKARVKAGRVLSDKNRKLLASIADQMEGAVSACRQFLTDSQPMADDKQKHVALTNHLRLKHERQQLGA